MNKKKLYEGLMENIEKSLQSMFEEIEDFTPKKEIKKKGSYVVESTYCDDVILKKLDLFSIQSEKFRNGVKVYCDGFQEALKVISIFEQFGALEKSGVYGDSFGSIKLYKWRPSVNDNMNSL